MKNIRKQFPVLNHYIYADTATAGLLYDGLFDWRQEHDLDVLIGGKKLNAKLAKIVADTRGTVAQFFNCNLENVALVPNFSIGFNLLLEGVGKQEKVLLLKGDYPSLTWPFKSRGHSVSYLEITANLEEQIYEKVKSEKIGILALSLVQWLNGFKIDLEFLKTLKRDFPDLIIIADGTQFCGTQAFNFKDSGIDVLGVSGYKWLLGGYGNGCVLFADGVADRFNCATIGFNSARGNLEGRDQISFANRFEPGHLDSTSFGSLNHSLKFLLGIGLDVVNEQVVKLSKLAFAEFGNLGLLQPELLEREHHSTIFNLSLGEKQYAKLMEHRVLCAQRGDGVRLSFHFYNTENEIEEIVDLLK